MITILLNNFKYNKIIIFKNLIVVSSSFDCNILDSHKHIVLNAITTCAQVFQQFDGSNVLIQQVVFNHGNFYPGFYPVHSFLVQEDVLIQTIQSCSKSIRSSYATVGYIVSDKPTQVGNFALALAYSWNIVTNGHIQHSLFVPDLLHQPFVQIKRICAETLQAW